MKILIVKTSAIGDVIHTLPALHAIRARYPDAHITWLVEEAAADIIAGHPDLDRVLVSRRKTWVKRLRPGSFRATISEIRRFLGELRDTSYDLIIDFQGLLKSGVLIGLARGRRKVGFGRGMEHAECSWIFLNERIPAVDMDIHAVDRECLLLEGIGIKCPEKTFFFPPLAESRELVLDMLIRDGYDRKSTIVALNPVAKWPTKLWHNGGFARVADELVHDGCFVVFTGSAEDQPVIGSIRQEMKSRALNWAGRTTLKTLAALYDMAAVVVSTDTGPMHIAAAVNTPVVALFGPTAPWRTGPYGDRHQVLRVDMDCSPCLKRECATMTCMKEITPEQVIAAVRRAVAGITDRIREEPA